MTTVKSKILIIDEQGFSRICSALLVSCGYQADIVARIDDLPEKLANNTYDLVVTSYPYGSALFGALREQNIPIIILTDGIDERLISILNDLQQSCCMIKPVDYDKFRSMVKQAVERTLQYSGGYCIV